MLLDIVNVVQFVLHSLRNYRCIASFAIVIPKRNIPYKHANTYTLQLLTQMGVQATAEDGLTWRACRCRPAMVTRRHGGARQRTMPLAAGHASRARSTARLGRRCRLSTPTRLGKSITSFTAPLPEPWRNTQATHTTRQHTHSPDGNRCTLVYRHSRAGSYSIASTRGISRRTLLHSEGYIGCLELTAPELGASLGGMQRHWRSHQHACRR